MLTILSYIKYKEFFFILKSIRYKNINFLINIQLIQLIQFLLHHYIYFIFFYSKTDCYFSIIKIASFSFALNYHRKETKIPIALIPYHL